MTSFYTKRQNNAYFFVIFMLFMMMSTPICASTAFKKTFTQDEADEIDGFYMSKDFENVEHIIYVEAKVQNLKEVTLKIKDHYYGEYDQSTEFTQTIKDGIAKNENRELVKTKFESSKYFGHFGDLLLDLETYKTVQKCNKLPSWLKLDKIMSLEKDSIIKIYKFALGKNNDKTQENFDKMNIGEQKLVTGYASGDSVTVRRLQKRKELNGTCGIIGKFFPPADNSDSGRYEVKLDAPFNESIKAKEINLQYNNQLAWASTSKLAVSADITLIDNDKSSESKTKTINEKYEIYNMIDVADHEDVNSLCECFRISFSIFKETDSDIKEFNNHMEVREEIRYHLINNMQQYAELLASQRNEEDKFEWDKVHQQIFFDLHQVNIIVYKKEEDVYIESSKFFDSAYKYTIRLAHINPENDKDSTMYYVLLEKDHIVKEECQWYPKEHDFIKHMSTANEYMVSSTKKDFILVKELQNYYNTKEKTIIEQIDRNQLYEYTHAYDVIDHEDINKIQFVQNDSIILLEKLDDCNDLQAGNLLRVVEADDDHLTAKCGPTETFFIYQDEFTKIAKVSKKVAELPDTQFDGYWESIGNNEYYAIKGNGFNRITQDSKEFHLFSTFLTADNHSIMSYTQNGRDHSGLLIKQNLNEKFIFWANGESVWRFMNELPRPFNIGDHVEVLEEFDTNTFLEDQKHLSKGQQLMIKKKKNQIIFVLNTVGKPWTHLQPIDSTNFQNLKHCNTEQVLIKKY